MEQDALATLVRTKQRRFFVHVYAYFVRSETICVFAHISGYISAPEKFNCVIE